MYPPRELSCAWRCLSWLIVRSWWPGGGGRSDIARWTDCLTGRSGERMEEGARVRRSEGKAQFGGWSVC